MSKKPFKSQASSSRIGPQAGSTFAFRPDASSKGFGSAPSVLSYITEQPDLSNLADPNTVVQFKNLGKKDSTTKAKALEDLQANLTSTQEDRSDIEEAFLVAWVKVYPRLSIDISRRVRQLAHSFHGLLCVRSGKRIAKYMPDVIGAWFAGSRDRDKVVSRAANEAFNTVFPSSEKLAAIPKVYQTQILEFCNRAILNESVQSLSDERTTNAEDAESKFYRVLSSTILAICALLEQLHPSEVNKSSELYSEILASEKFWDLLASKDQTIRRSVFKLVRSGIEHHKDLLSPYADRISNVILSKRAVKRQKGTAVDYVASLQAISSSFPSFWTTPAIKDDIINRLSDFIKYGSQGAHEAFWKLFGDLFNSLPKEFVPHESSTAVHLMNAIRSGVTRKEEPRSNIDHGWECYVRVANRISSLLSSDIGQEFVSATILPIIEQYVNPDSQNAEWTITGTRPVNTIASLMRSAIVQDLCIHFPAIADKLCEGIKTVAPEQSRDFESSQTTIANRGSKWFKLYTYTPEDAHLLNVSRIMKEESVKILTVSLETLNTRMGKPFGLGKIVEAAVISLKTWAAGDDEVSRAVDLFLVSDVPRLLFSPSRSQVISILYESIRSQRFVEAWNNTLETILNSENPDQLSVLQEFLTCSKAPSGFEEPLKSPELQRLLRSEVDRSIDGLQDWAFLVSIAAAPAFSLSQETVDHMIGGIADSLVEEEKAIASLTALEMFISRSQQKLIESLQYQADSSLRQNILLLTESEDDNVADRATELNRLIESAVSKDPGVAPSVASALKVISNGLRHADRRSLSIDTLVELAQRYIGNLEQKAGDAVKQILPNLQEWAGALEAMLRYPIPASFAISIQLGGALFLADKPPSDHFLDINVQYDREGYSIPLRMALYVLNIAEDATLFNQLIEIDRGEIFRLLLLTFQLVDDNITKSGSTKLWMLHENSIEEEMLRYMSRSGILFKKWLKSAGERHTALESDNPRSFVEHTKIQLLNRIQDQSALAVRHGRAYCYISTESLEIHGWNTSFEESVSIRFEQLRESDDILMLLTFVAAYRSQLSGSRAYSKSSNELLSSLTGAKLAIAPSQCLRQLIILDSMLSEQDHLVESIPKQRIVFFVKNVIPWLQNDGIPDSIKTQVCKLLATLLPHIKDVYGSHWSDTLNFLVSSWSQAKTLEHDPNSARLPLEYASIRLLGALKELALDSDVNDDLQEALQESSESLANAMITQLGVLNTKSDEIDQHLRTVNELLCRQIAEFPAETTRRPADLYALIAVESVPVQRTAFEILHKQIPKIQEQISIDTALEKTVAKLPEELLSLIIEAPGSQGYGAGSSDRLLPTAFRRYLSSWLLVFDHFKGSSDKVRGDYAGHLKEGDYLATLLDFISDALGHSRGRPVDVSKFDIAVYSFDIEESSVKDLQWILTHLYFLSLKHTPALTKAWWVDCSSRQTKVNVESWTKKFISPQLISDALSLVDGWAKKQDDSSEESVTVKTNPRTKEVTVSKEIDEQVMSMAIPLPDNFPFGKVIPYGINRVAVDDKKWRSWLLNTQGVIIFSNYSLIDGIVAFRRNVVGALKGQSECAICYAIVAADKQLPTKKCGTCNNLFHSSCLYRWFKTSNSSSCPLCRNPFNYT